MPKVALVETKPSRTNFSKEFDGAFEFDSNDLLVNRAGPDAVLSRGVGKYAHGSEDGTGKEGVARSDVGDSRSLPGPGGMMASGAGLERAISP